MQQPQHAAQQRGEHLRSVPQHKLKCPWQTPYAIAQARLLMLSLHALLASKYKH
jgi:hypothetical protein